MSDMETKKLYLGKYLQAEGDRLSGQPLTRPIYFRALRNGHYMTLDEARAFHAELADAIRSVELAWRADG